MLKQKLNCILLIDDDEPTNFLNKLIIEEANCAEQVLVEQSASDALAFLSNQPGSGPRKHPLPYPELIFLDINMPAMDGWDFLEQYAALPPAQKAAIVVVMLTTSANPEDELKARQLGYIAEFKNKPLTAAMLESVLREHFPERF